MDQKDFKKLQEIGQNAFECLQEMIEGLEDEDTREEAEQTIHEDALSIELTWRGTPEGWMDDPKPTGYIILLSTGGPATRIVGDLSVYCEPDSARLEVQDWFLPWTEIRVDEDTLLTYARCFYFGE